MMMAKRWSRWAIAVAVMSWMVVGTAVMAMATERGDDEVSRITRQVSQDVYSPYCPGQTLAMCPSANASTARQEIQEMARQGMEAEEIKRELLDRYGDEYEMIEPSNRDQMTLLGGIVAGLALAAVAVGLLARRRLTDDDEEEEGDEDQNPPDDGDDELYLEELRAEVEQ